MTGAELDRVSYRVGRRALVEGISLTVPPGQVIALLGPNGAGKSTALRLLAGELTPSEGSVRLAGLDVRSLGRLQMARMRAVVAQRSELSFDFRVEDVVLLGRHPFNGGHPRRADARVVRRALEQVDLHHAVDRGYTTLSGGERQRVQIARSLAQLEDVEPPGFWLLDEPTSALDLAHQHALLRMCRDQAERGRGVLVVLHDLNLALRHVDRAVLIHGGRVHAQGPVREVISPEHLQAVYGVHTEVVGGVDGRAPHVCVL